MKRGIETNWWGECPCQGTYGNGNNCREVARYWLAGSPVEKVFCGIHSKKKDRKELPKNPDAAEHRRQDLLHKMNNAHAYAQSRYREGLSGTVTATKMRMMRVPVPQPGHLPIFPNNKHAHSFGYTGGDFSGLSPLRLGPVMTTMSVEGNIEVAKNIENYHQSAKVFPHEMTKTSCDCALARRGIKHNTATPEFYKARDEAYKDTVAHRHKFDAADIKKANKNNVHAKTNSVNTPMYSVQVVNGIECHFSYVESRYFYCVQMELLAQQTAAYKKLVDYYNHGYALEIFGYDAYPPNGTDPESLYQHYCDTQRPFGHEMVILAMIVLTPGDYPWRRYYKEHIAVYVSVSRFLSELE